MENSKESWSALIKKAKGIDVGYIALLLFLGGLMPFIYALKIDDTLKLAGYIVIGILAYKAFDAYSKRKKYEFKPKASH